MSGPRSEFPAAPPPSNRDDSRESRREVALEQIKALKEQLLSGGNEQPAADDPADPVDADDEVW